MMAAGHRFTVPAAQKIAAELDSNLYKVLFDHGGAQVSNRIVVWFGKAYVVPHRPKQLAYIDIAVAERQSRNLLALIEIEDTTHNPKTLIGDAMATLLGEGIAVGQDSGWQVGAWTSLIVCAHFDSRTSQSRYQERIRYIERQIQAVHRQMTQKTAQHVLPSNAYIGQLIVDSFVDQGELDAKLSRYVRAAIRAAGNAPGACAPSPE